MLILAAMMVVLLVQQSASPADVSIEQRGCKLRPAAGMESDTSIEWPDDTHLDLNTSGKTFHFVIKGKQLTEVTAR